MVEGHQGAAAVNIKVYRFLQRNTDAALLLLQKPGFERNGLRFAQRLGVFCNGDAFPIDTELNKPFAAGELAGLRHLYLVGLLLALANLTLAAPVAENRLLGYFVIAFFAEHSNTFSPFFLHHGARCVTINGQNDAFIRVGLFCVTVPG